ncbi:SDR family oxidoreductase [Clostridium sp. AM58-1XD]|uniref:SDR family oxidoreductase n=1 Tax=Clostridium sp. AM58-1XD TaxID=2292307 RepID=UPI000E532CA3|nr:SDR family oxidoreductase [Clostridium sp. AM58-1XD]RGY99053.1 SDR family NAD(P)-dependent oxidoreductase [Clostridium sp. AM58-1XD]
MIQYEKVNGNFDLTGKTAIVVGGAGGIGEATAQMYARKGARVAIVDCKDNCPEVAAKIAEEFGVQTIGVKCDVTSQESVDGMMKTVLEAFREINILAAMPGFVDLYRAEEISISTIEKHMSINAVGVFRVCQAVANQMIRQGKGGKMVCVTSQADFIAINKHVGYTMSKAAVVGMIKVCALEWAEYGINVNGVAPTVVNTYMGEKAWQGKVKTDMIEKIPAHRFAETDEIAAAVLFLSCNESNMITGEDLVVDGGFTIY